MIVGPGQSQSSVLDWQTASPVANASTRSFKLPCAAAARWAHLDCRLPQGADPPLTVTICTPGNILYPGRRTPYDEKASDQPAFSLFAARLEGWHFGASGGQRARASGAKPTKSRCRSLARSDARASFRDSLESLKSPADSSNVRGLPFWNS